MNGEIYLRWKLKQNKMKRASLTVEVFNYKNVKGEENVYIKVTNDKGRMMVMQTSNVKATTLGELIDEQNNVKTEPELPFEEPEALTGLMKVVTEEMNTRGGKISKEEMNKNKK